MAKNDHSVKAAEKLMKVVEFLGRGDILGWKSVREVAGGAGVTTNEAFRILHSLVKGKWAEQGERGFRLAPTGLMEMLLYVQKYLARLARQFGVKVAGHKEEVEKE
jgi:DNA-binding IclR family transcriptional regulator